MFRKLSTMLAKETGFDISRIRAIVMCYPDSYRSYNDTISKKLLSKADRFLLKIVSNPLLLRIHTSRSEKNLPGMLGYYFSRFNYFDKILKECLINEEMSNFVNLGSGMDCKAYYIQGIEKVHYFEVDYPYVIEKKKEKIKKLLGKLPDHVTYIPIDFNTQNIEEELTKSGFKLSSQSLFICESVLPYLTKKANDLVFNMVGKAAPGSKFVFSYINNNLVSGEGLSHKTLLSLHNELVKKHSIITNGYEPKFIEEHITRYGLNTIEHISPIELEAKYKKLETLDISVAEVENFILAKVI